MKLFVGSYTELKIRQFAILGFFLFIQSTYPNNMNAFQVFSNNPSNIFGLFL